MALETVRKKLDAARKDYERERKKLGKDLRNAIVEAIAEVIPDGWYVRWSHSDQMYNDEDYYWGFNFMQLVTLKEPRQGEMIKEATPKVFRKDKNWAGQEVDVWVSSGEPAEYEWHIDSKCKKREDFNDVDSWEDHGVVDVRKSERPDPMPFGLTEDQCDEVFHLLRRLRQEELQQAFGDIATVLVFKNGKCVVNDVSEED